VIQGYAYLDVNVKQVMVGGKLVNALNALDGTGYQFCQTRGLAVIDSPIGLVACLPMGMAQVSSVVCRKGSDDSKRRRVGLLPVWWLRLRHGF